ncbi:hypothetical protein Ancab_011483 [Ancistrocladus abbreviatus]
MRIEQELQLENELEIVEQHEEHVENNDVEIADGVNGQEVLPEGNEDLLEQTHVAVGDQLKRRYYDPYGDKDERITHCPDNILED